MAIPPDRTVFVFHDGPATHARLLGPLNLETVSWFQEQLDRALRPDCRLLTLDLGAADYADSDGIRWLQRLHGELSARQVELRLTVREGSRVARTLDLVQLGRALPIERSAAATAAAPELGVRS